MENPSVSGAAVPYCLDIHSTLATQVGITSGYNQFLVPKSSIEGSNPIEFDVTPGYNCALDLQNTVLLFTGLIVDEDGDVINSMTTVDAVGDVPAREEANPSAHTFPVDNIQSSLLEDVIVSINGTTISGGDNHYAYRANFESKLSFSEEVKKNSCQLAMGYESSYGFDDLTEAKIAEICNLPNKNITKSVQNYRKRYTLTKDGKRFTVIGKIFSEIFEQPKLLPVGIGINVKLEFNKPKFYLLSKHPDLNPQIKINKAILIVRHSVIAKDVIYAQQLLADKGLDSIFPLRKVQFKTFSIGGPTTRDITINEVSNEYVPRRVFVAMVKNSSYNGDYTKDPFNYQHFQMDSIDLRVGGRSTPYTEIKTDFRDENEDYTLALYALLKSAHSAFGERDIGINMQNYMKGNVIFGFDLTPSQTPPGENFELLKSGIVSLHIKLRESIADSISILVYLEFDSQLSIDKYKNVKILERGPIGYKQSMNLTVDDE